MSNSWDDGSDWNDADWGTTDDSSVGTPPIEGTNDAWDSWENSDQQSNNFDDYGGQEQQNSWGNQNQQQVNMNQQSQNQTPVQFNFGYKMIGIICVVGFILLALIFSFFNKIKINKNTNQSGAQVSQVEQQQTQGQQNQSQEQQSSAVINGSALADNVNIDYSANIQQASGVVQSLSRIIQDGQLLYCISISIPYNNSTVIVKNYCTYNAYNSVQVGDMVNVTYQVVNGNLISVNEVTK